jgi:hypothetical protein
MNDYGIKGKPIILRNSKVHKMVEGVHQVIENIIRIFELESIYMDKDNPWKGILSATAVVMISIFHTSLQRTPG